MALTALLSGCSSDPEAGEALSGDAGPEASASASPVDPKPTPDPAESGGPAGGPAFEPASTGAPEVSRDGEAARRELTVAPVSFAEEATWSDGLRASTRGFSRGTITATGIYAFQVGPDISEGTFYLDVDGDHVIATSSGLFP
ncbi:hypothetical protein ACX80H_15250 [Arthrobacter sp. MDT2-2]